MKNSRYAKLKSLLLMFLLIVPMFVCVSSAEATGIKQDVPPGAYQQSNEDWGSFLGTVFLVLVVCVVLGLMIFSVLRLNQIEELLSRGRAVGSDKIKADTDKIKADTDKIINYVDHIYKKIAEHEKKIDTQKEQDVLSVAAVQSIDNSPSRLEISVPNIETWLNGLSMESAGERWMSRIDAIVTKSINRAHDMKKVEERGYRLFADSDHIANVDDFLAQVELTIESSEGSKRKYEKLANDLERKNTELELIKANEQKIKQALKTVQEEKAALEQEKTNLVACSERLQKELKNECGKYKVAADALGELRQNIDHEIATINKRYDSFIPENVLVLFGLSPERLADEDARRKFVVLRAYMNLMESTDGAFVINFQEFDGLLSELSAESDFAELRRKVERAINEQFAKSGFDVTWTLRGQPYDPELHTSESKSGNIISSVEKALIKKNGKVEQKAYVITGNA